MAPTPLIALNKKFMITPLNDKILIRLLSDVEGAEKNESGIFVPDSAKVQNQAIVVRVGEGTFDNRLEKTIPNDVQEGDRVLIGGMTWKQEIQEKGSKYYVIKNSDILAVITEDK